MILDVSFYKGAIVETDHKEFPTFRRMSPECWDNLMGESWESVYYCEDLEYMFQEFIRNNKGDFND